jgi:hypothetical protein
MVFIKGAWIELDPWDDHFHEYFCCPGLHLCFTSHIEDFNPATGRGEKHDPPMWITCHCGLMKDKREIPFTEEEFCRRAIIRPDWCPLKK